MKKLFFLKRFNYSLILFIFIVIALATFLRFYRIDNIPPLHADEVAFGYNSYSMLLTGKDESGKKFPLGLTSFNDFRPPLYAYIGIPFVKLFGLNALAIRIPSVIFSLISIFLIYKLVYLLSNNKEISIYSLLLIVFSFWDIQLAREASEKVVAQSFLLLGLLLIFIFLKKRFLVYAIIGFISWFLSINTYYSPRFTIPLLILAVFIFFYKEIFSNKPKIFIILTSIFLAYTVYITFFMHGSIERVNQLSIVKAPEAKLKLEEEIREDGVGTNVFRTRLFHNKIVAYSLTFLENYTSYFTTDYLFLNGGLPYRVKIPQTGLLPLIQFPFLILGFYAIFRKKLKWGLFSVVWLLLVPIPAALTLDETPNIYRTFAMLPPLVIISSVGIWYIRQLIKNKFLFKVATIVVILLFFWNFLYFLHQYFVHYQVHHPWFRDYAYKELVYEVNKLQKNYKQILITKGQGAPYLFFLFYSKYNPLKYQQEGSHRDEPFKGFGKYVFYPDDCSLYVDKKRGDETVGEEGILYVNKGNCVVPLYNAKLLKTINWRDNTSAFKILEYVSTASANIKK